MADIDIDLKGDAEAGIKAISKALRDADRDAKAAKKSVEQIAKETEKAAKEAEKNSLAAMFHKSQISANLASAAIEKAVEALVDFARTIPEGAAAAARHEQSLTSLGGAYDLVQQSTRGAVSAEQAAGVQARLSQANLSLTARELAAVTQRAREYARVNNVEVSQALEQLTDQLVDPGEELRRFGITIQTGRTKTEGMRDALRQLVTQAGQTAPAEQTLTEATDRFTRSTDLAKASLQGLIAERLHLKDFFDQAASWIDETARSANVLDRALEAVRGTISEAAGQGSTTTRTDGQASAFGARYGSAVDRLRRAGVDVRGYPLGGQLASLPPAEQARLLAMVERDAAQASQASGGRNLRGARGMFDQAVPGGPALGSDGPTQATTGQALSAAAAISEARRVMGLATTAKGQRSEAYAAEVARAEQQARDAAAAMAPVDPNALRQAQLAYQQASLTAHTAGMGGALGLSARPGTPEEVRSQRLAALQEAATATGAQRGENEPARLQRIAGAIQALVAATQQYREEDERLETQFRASAQAEKDRLETIAEGLRLGADAQRRHLTETLAAADEELQVRRQMDAALDPSGSGDARRSQERMRDLIELRNVYRDLLEQTDQRLAAARAEGRDTGEINTLMQERLGLLRAQSAATQELTQIQREQSAATSSFKEQMVGSLNGVADAFGAATVAALEGEKSFGEALGGMLREQAKALAKQAVMETLKNSALAVYNLAIGNFPAAANHGIAAGLWAGVGIAAGVTVAATRPSASGASGGTQGRQGASVERGARPDAGNGGGGPLVMNINVSGALYTEGVVEGTARAFRAAQATGLLPMNAVGRA